MQPALQDEPRRSRGVLWPSLAEIGRKPEKSEYRVLSGATYGGRPQGQIANGRPPQLTTLGRQVTIAEGHIWSRLLGALDCLGKGAQAAPQNTCRPGTHSLTWTQNRPLKSIF